jgi:non-ribosomal peptide synthase protein (TIGR01720 family)
MHRLREHGGAYDAFHQSTLLRVPPGLGAGDRLVTAVHAVLERHEALRGRLREDGSLALAPADPAGAREAVRRIEVPGTQATGEALRALIAARAAEDADALAPRAGAMLRVTWFDAGEGRQGRLLVTVHHLAVDAVSWHILLTDLYTAWHEAASGGAVRLEPVPVPLREWTARLRSAAQSPEVLAELPYWKRTVSPGCVTLTDARLSPSLDIHATAGALRLTLPEDLTEPLLSKAPAAFGARTNDVLLAGLALAVTAWRGAGTDAGGAVLVDVEGHGREPLADDADLSGTVGWLTSLYPVRLDAGAPDWTPGDDPASDARLGEAVRRVAAQLGRVPRRGIGYGLLRHLNPGTAAELAGGARPQVCFNYLGRQDRLEQAEADWGVAPEADALPLGADPRMPLTHVVEVNAAVEDGPAGAGGAAGPRLVAQWLWARRLLSDAEAGRLAELWFAALRALVAYGTARPERAEREEAEERARLAARIGTPVERLLPMTPTQEGLLFHARYDSGDLDVHNVQIALETSGPLDTDRFRAACDALLERHPMLRAAFLQRRSGEPVQAVPERVAMPWQTHDLTALDPAGRDARRTELLEADRRRRFDPARPPLMRCTVLALAEDRHEVVLSMHHMLVDGWTTSLVLRDLLALFDQDGDDRGLPVPGHYPDYLQWLAAQDRDEARAAWTEALAGLEEPTLVCPGRDTARVRALPETTTVELSEAATAALLDAARAHGVTLNTLVRVAWALCLHRRTGQRDITFGAVVSSREADLPDVDEMVGLFINTVPVRVRLDPAETVAGLLRRLQGEQAELLPYHHLALADLQRAVGRGPLFDTCVVFENYPTAQTLPSPDDGLRLVGFTGHDPYHYPLKLMAAPGDRLRLVVGHRPDLLDADAGRRTAADLLELLTTLPTALGEPTGRLLTGPPAPGAAAGPVEQRLCELIAEVLERTYVDADDDVFALGCDSLTALRLAGRIEADLGRSLDVGTVFRCRTARALAGELT